MTLLPLIVLGVLLALAVWNDLRTRRIPNTLVFGGAVVGLLLNGVLPAGAGLFIEPFGAIGFLGALAGWGVGLALLLPMYALRLMGAGDVKLLAMVGAFVGAGQILTVGLVTLVEGGVLALVFAAWQGSLRRLVGNAYHMAMHTAFSALAGSIAAPVTPPDAASGRLPYAIAIASASVGCVLWMRVHGELPL